MNLDRHERRQQRVRGAGPSAVQASFGFNFGALGAGPAKQASLPPQRPSRRTPTIHTPRGANGSAKRHRSASIQHSSVAKRRSTPGDRNRTPQLGKRKRSSEQAQAGAEEEEIDELSPDRDENVPSIEKSRKHARTVSPVHEKGHGEPDELSILQEEPDELSILEDGAKSVRRSFAHAPAAISGTRESSAVKQRPYLPSRVQESPIEHRSGASPATSQRSLPRRSKSTETVTVTPGMLPNRRPSRVSAMRSDADPATPATAPTDQDSVDEQSPSHLHQSTVQDERSLRPSSHETEMEADELSSPMQPSPAQTASVATLKKRGRPKKASEAQGEELQATPVARLNGKRKSTSTLAEFEQDELDELSPESDKARQRQNAPPVAMEEVPELSDAVESDEYEEPGPQDVPAHTPPARKRRSPKQVLRVKASSELPSRKRQKFLGPKHAISVMRIKGSTVRGITVADTARTILEESITHRLARMAEKLQNSKDSAQRKELRSWINLTLSFKESLDEKLLDLQDANDVLSTGFKKMKIFKRDNAGLRKEILGLQNSRQEVAIEHDAIQAEFDAEKERVETRNTLSANMYAIEAAVRNGREKALAEGREEEGPEIPLSMMIDNVGRQVGSLGGGLLDHVKGFNGYLERAAGWLEGRA